MNHLKSKMASSGVATALGVTSLRGSAVGLIARAAGFDALFIDLEHSPTTVQAAADICISALGQGITPLVRCSQAQLHDGVRLLDNGALGLVVADVETPDEGRTIIEACRYRPRGKRTIGRFFPQLGYRAGDWEEMGRQVDEITLLFLMIESREGVRNADKIAALPHVDGLFVGAGDLTIDLGGEAPQGQMTPALEAGVEVARACKKHNKLLGFGGWTDDYAVKTMIASGAKLVIAGSDLGLCLNGGVAATRRVHSLADAVRQSASAE